MKNLINKKNLFAALFATLSFLPVVAQTDNLPMAEGKFKPTDESLKQYQYPEWFRDAKFGIWSHWGPQAVPRQGDWYAKNIYVKENLPWWSHKVYEHHVKTYGHPSVFGYKDIIPLWKAERWNPEQLMKLYKKTGARYFVSMGTHHDNFFLWNSKIHKWNSVNMGPKKDVVGLWQKAAKKEGLRFGISEHLGASYTWFQTSHGSDPNGDKAGVPYDGNDPRYQDLYHKKAEPGDNGWLTNNPEWQKEWYDRIKEMIDMYQPDLVYSDSKLPFENVGRSLIAHYYNQDMKKNGGKLNAVYNCKEPSVGRFVDDIERGVKDTIGEYPWQTCTSIGDWYYRTGQQYKSSDEVIQMLVDIVSKNGNLLINVVQTPEGDLEPDILKILDGIGSWIKVNGEGIYGTRPWKVYGEKPANKAVVKTGNFNEGNIKYNAQDIRFTTKGDVLYAFCLGQPTEDVQIKSLGRLSKISGKTVASVKLMGSTEKLIWSQKEDALVISKPKKLPACQVIAFSITFKK